MVTKRIWAPNFDDRRARKRRLADFYAVELAGGGRYLRRVADVSRDGLLLVSPLADERPGQLVELELPRGRSAPMRVRAEVVRVTAEGKIGLRRLATSEPFPIESLGGRESL